jgi:hypothetical protein
MTTPPHTVAFQASATSNAATITGPASIVAGDIIVLLDRAGNTGSVPGLVTPTGFTSINNVTDGSFYRQNLSYKVATGTEAGASITGMSYGGAGYTWKAMAVFRASGEVESVSVVDAAGESSGGNPTAQSVSAGSGITPLVVIGAYSTHYATVDPRTFSTTKDGEISPDVSLYLAYKIYNSSPADSSIDMDDEGTNNALQSCYIQVNVKDVLEAAAGSFVLSGQNVALSASINALAGAFVLTGVGMDPSFSHPPVLTTFVERLNAPLGSQFVDQNGMLSGEWETFLKQFGDGYNELQLAVGRPH